MSAPKRILICPLDWGLGHATRCIPVIRLLLAKKAEVIIAADGRPLELLKQEFPQLQFITLKGYDISYPASGSMTFKMLLSAPKILAGIEKEHRDLDKMIDEHQIDSVISDNRYGCHSKKVKSIFITHQLMIKSPVAESTLHKMVLKYIKKYDECWVPDLPGKENLSGELAHKYELPENTFFTGALSRFTTASGNENLSSEKTNSYDIMAIVSGPEPQRSIFEELLITQIQRSGLKALLVCGKTELKTKNKNGNIEIVSHLKTEAFQQAVLNSKLIIARSGYSTVMDLAVLGKKVIFIPTPGQTEQEYLAELFMQTGIAFSQKQSEFDLQKAIKESENYTGFSGVENNELLEMRIDVLLQ